MIEPVSVRPGKHSARGGGNQQLLMDSEALGSASPSWSDVLDPPAELTAFLIVWCVSHTSSPTSSDVGTWGCGWAGDAPGDRYLGHMAEGVMPEVAPTPYRAGCSFLP